MNNNALYLWTSLYLEINTPIVKLIDAPSGAETTHFTHLFNQRHNIWLQINVFEWSKTLKKSFYNTWNHTLFMISINIDSYMKGTPRIEQER